MPFDYVQDALNQRSKANLTRKRFALVRSDDGKIVYQGKSYLDFSSNDYLGMAAHSEVIAATAEATKQYGVGSGGSSMVTGYHACHQALEEYIADWLGYERCMLFNSGFTANTGVLEALMNQSDALLIQDKLNHASLIDGGINCKAKSVRFKHNDMSSLATRLASDTKHKLVVTEGVFSMDGDMSPLSRVSDLSQSHNSALMIDDAHGIGVLGEQGRGSASVQGVAADNIDLHMATFGKAVGTTGAFVAGKAATIEYLLQFSRHYIYSTAMPPSMAVATLKSLKLIAKEQWRREKLHCLVEHFKNKVKQLGLKQNDSASAIQPIIIGDADKAMGISESLRQAGIWLTAIRPPTVPQATSRLRVTLTCHHKTQDIDQLFENLEVLL